MLKKFRFLAAVLLALATAASAQVGSPPGVGYPPFTSGGTFTGSLVGPTGCTLPPFSFSADTNAGLCLAAANTVRVQNNVTSGVSTSYVNLGATMGSLVFNDAAAFDSQVRVYDDTVDIAAAGANQLTIAGATSMFTFGNTTTRDELILQPVVAGAGSFSGTFTTADLTVARTWTFPDLDGTPLFGNTSTQQVLTGGSAINFDSDAGGDTIAWERGIGATEAFTWGNAGFAFAHGTGYFNASVAGDITLTAGNDGSGTLSLQGAAAPQSIVIGGGVANRIYFLSSFWQDSVGGEPAFYLEGDTEDGFELKVQTRDPTVDREVFFPDAAGEVVIAGELPVTIPDNGGGTPATYTLDPNGVTVVTFTCSDANGCEVTMGETFARAGQPLTIIEAAAGAGNITLIHNGTTATLDAAGNVVFTGINDAVQLIYAGSIWHQVAPLYDAT